jgi:hypothetical protein
MNLYDPEDFSGLTPNLQNQIMLKGIKPRKGHRGRPRDIHAPVTAERF